MIEFDASELRALELDLGQVPTALAKDVNQVLKVGANKIKKNMRAEATGVQSAPAFPWAISYDSTVTADAVEYEIGPVKGGAGSLALLYLGNSNSAPRLPDPKGILDREAVFIEKFIGDAMEGIL